MEPEPLTIAQQLRLRIEPSLEATVRIMVPAGSLVEMLSVQADGWVQIRAQDETSAGWCRRQMLDAARRKEYAQLINDSGQHLLSVVNGILNMPKMESGNLIPYIRQRPCGGIFAGA